MKSKFKDLTGMTFDYWTVIEKIYIKNHASYYKCQCKCGNIKNVLQSNLVCGKSKSCGCISANKLSKLRQKHRKSNSKLYLIWSAIKRRCCNQNSKDFKNYGGRGIKVCKEWTNNFMNFYNWAIANGYKEGLEIDRIDVNGNYEPSNCRWATIKEQNNNRRNTRYVIYKNKKYTITELSDLTGVKRNLLYERIYKRGFSVEDAINLPVKKGNNQNLRRMTNDRKFRN